MSGRDIGQVKFGGLEREREAARGWKKNVQERRKESHCRLVESYKNGHVGWPIGAKSNKNVT